MCAGEDMSTRPRQNWRARSQRSCIAEFRFFKAVSTIAILDYFATATCGGSSLYMTGVTKRASKVELIRPPMTTHASGE